MSDWLMYWRPETVLENLDLRRGGRGKSRLAHAASDQLRRVQPDDRVWIATMDWSDQLRRLGPLVVAHVVDQHRAERPLKSENPRARMEDLLDLSPMAPR